MRTVLDTNVVLSALLWRGTPYHLLETFRRSDGTQLFASISLMEELARVLVRPFASKRLKQLGRTVNEVLEDYVSAVGLVSPVAIPRVVTTDLDDDHVIATAVAAEAELLVSGDADLLKIGTHRGIRIVTPAEALQLIVGD